MKVFILGGAGRHGRRVAYLLSSSPEIGEVVIGARDLASATMVAERIGPKATVVRVDALDEAGVAQAARGARLMVNASGPYFETLLPALRAAIGARIHYCDFSEDGRTVEQAFAMDAAARAAGIIAILGIGDAPGITNLMALHAARQLDRAEEIVVGWTDDFEVVYRSVQENLRTIRTSGHVDASLQATLNASTGKIRTFVGGRWMDEDALGRAVSVMLPTGQSFSAFPLGWAEPVMLPRSIPQLKSVTSLVNLLPPQMNELMRAEASFIAEGRLRPREATIDMLESVNVDPARWLKRPHGMMVGALFAIVRGVRNGRPAICGIVPNWGYAPAPDWVEGFGTGAPCSLAALRVLRGEVERPGVMGPEACFEPMSFFGELVHRWGAGRPAADLVAQEFHYEEPAFRQSVSGRA
ncbi:MAG TPA: saccharopine dehydrogenase NADP-binding domain-containing protein [Alphaproteobacteria bacterium]